MATQQNKMTLFNQAFCQRCGIKLKVNPKPGSKATMLRRANQRKGYCLECAIHDWLRNTYPINLLLARSGPKGLALPHIQRQFFDIAVMHHTDAQFSEINWIKIIDNWELPFPEKVKRSAINPMNEQDIVSYLKRERALKADGLTDQERRAKNRQELEYAVGDLIGIVNPESKNKTIHIVDDEPCTIRVFVENNDAGKDT